MLAVAVAVAVAASLAGIYLSFFLDSAPAPTIVLLLSGTFVAAFLVSRLRAARAERAAERDLMPYPLRTCNSPLVTTFDCYGFADRTSALGPRRRETAAHAGCSPHGA